MKKRLLFVFNPKSGKALIKTKLLEIIDIFTKHDYDVIVHPTQERNDAYHLAKHSAHEYDLVVCSGGDGTLDEVVSGMKKNGADVPLGYIPSGSTNDFATSLSIEKNMIKAAEEIMEGKVYGCDVGVFNNRYFVYIAAFGLFTDVSYLTDQTLKNMLGHMAYLLEGVKRIIDIKSYHMKVEANGQSYEADYVFGMITNSRSVGGFKHITGKNVEMDDGLFEVTLIRKPTNPMELQKIMTALLTGEDNTEMVDSFKTSHITLISDEEIPWTLDGDFGGEHTEVLIENKKQALKIILNPSKHEEHLKEK